MATPSQLEVAKKWHLDVRHVESLDAQTAYDYIESEIAKIKAAKEKPSKPPAAPQLPKVPTPAPRGNTDEIGKSLTAMSDQKRHDIFASVALQSAVAFSVGRNELPKDVTANAAHFYNALLEMSK